MMELFDNPAGGYRFASGIAPYSAGVIAMPGYEIVRVTLQRSTELLEGFEFIDQWLTAHDRPRQALCAVELRLPQPLSFDGFLAFNEGYQGILEEWDLMVDGRNPVARTNIAPVVRPPLSAALYGFSYTTAIDDADATTTGGASWPPTFIVAGAGDLRDQSELSPDAIVRADETSPDAMREKALTVMAVMRARLDAIGADWSQVTATTVYTTQPLLDFLPDTLLSSMGAATGHGVQLYYSHPPIRGLEFEMDVRGVRKELRAYGV